MSLFFKTWILKRDYIHWSNSAGQGVARVHLSPDGTVWYWRYKNIQCMDIIKTPGQVTWMTCKPEKYLGRKDGE